METGFGSRFKTPVKASISLRRVAIVEGSAIHRRVQAGNGAGKRDGGFRFGVIDSGYIDAIAIAREIAWSASTSRPWHHVRGANHLRRRRGPRNDRPRPWPNGPKENVRRDQSCVGSQIRMRENACRSDLPTRGNVLAKRNHRFDLLWRIGRQAPIWPRFAISIPIETFHVRSAAQTPMPACQARCNSGTS